MPVDIHRPVDRWMVRWAFQVNWDKLLKQQVSEPLHRTLCTLVVWNTTTDPNHPQDPAPWDSTASSPARPHKAWTPLGTRHLVCARHHAKYYTHTISYNLYSISRRKYILSPFRSLSFYPLCYPAPGHGKCSSARQDQDLSSALPGWEADPACYFCPSQPSGLATSSGIGFII